jgi:hypothetical protein
MLVVERGFSCSGMVKIGSKETVMGEGKGRLGFRFCKEDKEMRFFFCFLFWKIVVGFEILLYFCYITGCILYW